MTRQEKVLEMMIAWAGYFAFYIYYGSSEALHLLQSHCYHYLHAKVGAFDVNVLHGITLPPPHP